MTTFRSYDSSIDGAFPATSQRLKAAPQIVITDDDGKIWFGHLINNAPVRLVSVMRTDAEVAADLASQAAVDDEVALRTQLTQKGLQLLQRAARYAKNPVAHSADQLTARQVHIVLVLLGLAVREDFTLADVGARLEDFD